VDRPGRSLTHGPAPNVRSNADSSCGPLRRCQTACWDELRAAAHCGIRRDAVLSDDLPLLSAISNWSAWLSIEEEYTDLEFIRRRTQTGRPCASDEFVRKLESQFGILLLPKKTGPKKRQLPEDTAEGQSSLGFD